MRGVTALLGLVLLATGCTGREPLLRPKLPAADRGLELSTTPFFPQQAYQCGPAALATLLVDADVAVEPSDLTAKVYLPGREGSLQVELVGAARRYGLIPYVIAPSLDALIAELRDGRPVLVLQNLGLSTHPIWHYAVVIGYDPEADEILLRSGTVRRDALSTRRFLGTWKRAGYWALVVLQPGQLPARPNKGKYLRAVAAVESMGLFSVALSGYRAALQRWPGEATAQLGLANSYYGLGRPGAAERGYRQLLDEHPQHTAGYNNLAQVLAEQGRYGEALAQLARGVSLNHGDPDLHKAMQATRMEIRQLRSQNRR